MCTLLVVALMVPVAQAGEPELEASIGARLSGEALQDPRLVSAYTAEGLGGELTAALPLVKGFRLRVCVGYHRRAGKRFTLDGTEGTASSWLMYLPISAPVFYDVHAGSVSLGVGVGPSYLVFAEPSEAPPDDPAYADVAQSGGKFGLTFEAEARIATDMVSRSLHAPDEGPRRLDVVIGLGYRASVPHLNLANTEGLNFSAVRLGAGLELVY